MKVEDEEYQLRPMNCPFHVNIYKNGYYSYRDLPVRLAELGTVYRWVSPLHTHVTCMLTLVFGRSPPPPGRSP